MLRLVPQVLYICLGSKMKYRIGKIVCSLTGFLVFVFFFFFHFTSFWPDEFACEHSFFLLHAVCIGKTFALSLPMLSYQERSQNFTLVILPTALVLWNAMCESREA